jgi:hypothetical protein
MGVVIENMDDMPRGSSLKTRGLKKNNNNEEKKKYIYIYIYQTRHLALVKTLAVKVGV